MAAAVSYNAVVSGKPLWLVALNVQVACWVLFLALSAVIYVRAERERRSRGSDQGPAIRSAASLWGLLLELGALAIVWLIRRPSPHQVSPAWLAAAILLAPASMALLVAAEIELGRQFRLKAVVASDHQLVTTGPYGIVRHPIYASLFGLIIANAMVVSRWEAAAAALVVLVIGTEIRVKVEDGLLARRFPGEFPKYRAAVRAYLPFLR